MSMLLLVIDRFCSAEIDFIRIKVYNNYNKIWQTGP